MLKINHQLTPAGLGKKLARFWDQSAQKITSLQRGYDSSKGSPVFTVNGKYTARGWTEWTQGFQFGGALLQFDATGEKQFLEAGREATLKRMAPHITHFGVHDHGFNNVSTYGNLWRLMNEGRIPENEWERNFYEMALKCSGAIQARRFTKTKDGGYVYSFNGPHSLFVDTIRSMRALAVAHQLGGEMMGDNDERISLLDRLVHHATATATHSVYYGDGRDRYDVRGRTAHEAIFNTNDGNFRCPNSQQGYSPFSTWTRGLAWAMVGFAEQLEFIGDHPAQPVFLKAAKATCDFYLENTPTDGIPYWDTGAPELHKLGSYLDRASDPYNECEPIDSSAAAIAAQGLLRLGRYLQADGARYWQAGLTVLDTLFDEPYLSADSAHQGLILHSVYHQPNGWDYIPPGRKVPCGESSMWGDYHAQEVALLVQREIDNKPYLQFFKK
ncbi:MAG: glycoside hydrolase family 88 protein [Verrucomicrobiae bacterium]